MRGGRPPARPGPAGRARRDRMPSCGRRRCLSTSSAIVAWPRTQSGPWNSAAATESGVASTCPPGSARVDIGLPPASLVRDETQRAVSAPGRLANGLLGAARHPPRRAGRLERIRTGRRAGDRGRAATRRSPRRPRACRGDPRRSTAKRSPAGSTRGVPKKSCSVEQRGLARLAHPSSRARRCSGSAFPRPPGGPPAPPGPSRRQAMRSVRRGGARLLPAVARSAAPVWPRPAGPSQNHTRCSTCST